MKIKANDGKVYEVPDNPVWHSGPPPEIGWWPASRIKNQKMLRWWDGKKWSLAIDCTSDSVFAEITAKMKTGVSTKVIQWTDRWWLKGGK